MKLNLTKKYKLELKFNIKAYLYIFIDICVCTFDICLGRESFLSLKKDKLNFLLMMIRHIFMLMT